MFIGQIDHLPHPVGITIKSCCTDQIAQIKFGCHAYFLKFQAMRRVKAAAAQALKNKYRLPKSSYQLHADVPDPTPVRTGRQ